MVTGLWGRQMSHCSDKAHEYSISPTLQPCPAIAQGLVVKGKGIYVGTDNTVIILSGLFGSPALCPRDGGLYPIPIPSQVLPPFQLPQWLTASESPVAFTADSKSTTLQVPSLSPVATDA